MKLNKAQAIARRNQELGGAVLGVNNCHFTDLDRKRNIWWFDLPVSSYSSGMRARVAFGTSMAFQFDYYLIDEVMGVGDARFKAKSRALFAERLKSSKIILVSHSMKLIKAMCEVVVHLDRGVATVYEDVEAGIAAYERMGGKE